MHFNKIGVLLVILLYCKVDLKSQTAYYADIRWYADSLYHSFDKLQKRNAMLSFSDTARIQWNNLPVGMRARSGLNIGNMTNEQRRLVHRILSVSLSSQGYLKASGVMHLDNLINSYYDSLYHQKYFDDNTYTFIKSLQWSHKNFYFAFFGKPSDNEWGYKIEGHHLSVNFTFSNNHIAVTPFFIGTDPAEYMISEFAGWRVLGQEEDLGLKLINQLSPALRKKATMNSAVPQDIITAAESGKRLVDYWGIKASELTTPQKSLLDQIIREFVFNMEFEKASLEYQKILKAGTDNIYFGWIGEYAEDKQHYFIINGPTFIIEFDNAGGPRNTANHIHAIWREKGNDFGEDILKQHYKIEKHGLPNHESKIN
jgi:hypothetical protein